MSLGYKIKQARQHKGLSQAALAAASGVKQQMISKLETGKSIATKDILQIAKALDVNAEWLGGIAEEPATYQAQSAMNQLDNDTIELIFTFCKIDYGATFQQLSVSEQARIFKVCYESLNTILHKKLSQKQLFLHLREALNK